MYRADHLADKRVLDAHLAALAHTVLAFAQQEREEIFSVGRKDTIQREIEGTLGTRYYYQIWSPHDRLLLQGGRLPSSAPMRPLAERGFADARIDGGEVRTYTQGTKNGEMVIQIAERLSERQAAVGVVTGYFLAILIAPLGLIFVSTRAFLNLALRSIDGYASQLRQRDALDLTPLRADNPPTELEPMVASIDALLARFGQALSLEREFTAVAAHEMRTPLAALRAQAQLANTLAHSPLELSSALRGLMKGIDQATHLQDQLLNLARIESLAVPGRNEKNPVDLQEVYHRVMSDLGPTAARRNLALKARFNVAQLSGVDLGVHLLMHNMLVNAIHYTPSGGSIEICSIPDGEAVLLKVDDSGPGIPATQRLAAMQRFNRLGRGDSLGVGLGLSIVQSVAHAHHAVVQLLESPLGGLRVQVRFPSNSD